MSVLFLTCDVDNCTNTDKKHKLHRVPFYMEKSLKKLNTFQYLKSIDFICEECIQKLTNKKEVA